MSATITYQERPEWGMLTAPLRRMLENQNGISGTALDALHGLALTKFEHAEFPGRKHEDWKYTPLRELVKTQFTAGMVPDKDYVLNHQISDGLDAVRIVFVDGYYMPHLSDSLPEEIWIGSVHEALRNPLANPYLEHVVQRLSNISMTPFEALTTSITDPGICMYATAGAQLSRPVHFLHVISNTRGAAVLSYPYKLIGIGKNASVNIVESFIGLDPGAVAFTNSVAHIIIENGARLRLHRMQDEGKQSFHINMTRVFQERDSVYDSMAVELGAKLMRNNIEVVHEGSGITTNLYGVFVAEDRQHMDTQSFIDHAKPHCESHELYKGILDGYARGVFNGKIVVRPDAQKTNAFQQNSTLLLSRDAVMDSKPQLEIFADDVKCSHGATIGQLDENALFYLRTRGLTKSQASAMLQRAFIGEVLDKCAHEEIRNYLSHSMESRHHD